MWRVVLVGDGSCYLVHVEGHDKREAKHAAAKKVLRDYFVHRVRATSAERIPA